MCHGIVGSYRLFRLSFWKLTDVEGIWFADRFLIESVVGVITTNRYLIQRLGIFRCYLIFLCNRVSYILALFLSYFRALLIVIFLGRRLIILRRIFWPLKFFASPDRHLIIAIRCLLWRSLLEQGTLSRNLCLILVWHVCDSNYKMKNA